MKIKYEFADGTVSEVEVEEFATRYFKAQKMSCKISIMTISTVLDYTTISTGLY